MYRIALLLSVVLLHPVMVVGQNGVNISSGAGITELVHIGAHYQFDQAQAGLTVGLVPFLGDDSFVSLSADIYYHFAGESQYSERRPWYVRTSTVYIRSYFAYSSDRSLHQSSTDHNVYQTVKVGRDFNLGHHIGLSVSAGPAVRLHHVKYETLDNETFRLPRGITDLGMPRLMPDLDIRVFYRL